MIILGIETSCDETALALLECTGSLKNPKFTVLAEELYSQIEIHKPYGGVFPMLAKREHGKNLIPLFKNLLNKSGFQKTFPSSPKNSANGVHLTSKVLAREPELAKDFTDFIPTIDKPPIDIIAVTAGPGLEPALWVGINFAKALATTWDIPVMPSNHMEGHLFSVLVHRVEDPKSETRDPKETRQSNPKLLFPVVALLVSGGHTDLVFAKDWLHYTAIGTTRDDAVGEAFDKVARILGLPYPGGPEISRLARESREKNYPNVFPLPRPMINSGDLDFSFSGLKTAVLYNVQKFGTLTHEQKAAIAREFEDAAVDVLIEKTRRAMKTYEAKTLVVGGGVIANAHLRERLAGLAEEFPNSSLLVPDMKLTTDNAVMIAAAAYLRMQAGAKPLSPEENLETSAEGTMQLS